MVPVVVVVVSLFAVVVLVLVVEVVGLVAWFVVVTASDVSWCVAVML